MDEMLLQIQIGWKQFYVIAGAYLFKVRQGR